MLLDSNIFIYAIQDDYEELRQWCVFQEIFASEISRLEVLGYHQLSEEDKADFITLFARTEIYPITRAIIELGITLRQQRKMSVGDAIIAATALTYRETLATRNIDDFKWIDGLDVINPIY
jgi:predicted nucleic acid-binding protein